VVRLEYCDLKRGSYNKAHIKKGIRSTLLTKGGEAKEEGSRRKDKEGQRLLKLHCQRLFSVENYFKSENPMRIDRAKPEEPFRGNMF